MADKDACDTYAAEAARRFDEYVKWARDNWPVKALPLLDSDFDAARQNLSVILGDRLAHAREASSSVSDPEEGGPQFVSVNPAPWP
ncbi:MAG: hypothetical protein JWP36_1702 [Paucimonas sp.]|nr:hypothetical protein [Paucimonas sp.]